MNLTKDNILDELLKIYPKAKEYADGGLHVVFGFYIYNLIDAIKSGDKLKVQEHFNFINQMSELNDDDIEGLLAVNFLCLYADVGDGDYIKNLSENSRNLFNKVSDVWKKRIESDELEKKLSIGEFYNTIRKQFPGINKLEIWKEHDWKTEPWTHSFIMTEIAREIFIWVDSNEIKQVQNFLDYIELSNQTGDSTLTSYIYTDFLVTISEQKKNTRETIKSMLGPDSKKLYAKLMDFYHELDQ